MQTNPVQMSGYWLADAKLKNDYITLITLGDLVTLNAYVLSAFFELSSAWFEVGDNISSSI